MKLRELSNYFTEIAQIASRTEITQKLAELFGKATPHEAQIIANLSQGSLRPPYEGTQFNIAERSMKKILAELLDISPEAITALARQEGDLGKIAAQGTWQGSASLTVIELYDALTALEEIVGTGSQDERAVALKKLLHQVSPAEAGLIIRIVLGKLRLGFSDMTLIDALSWMLVGDKSVRTKIEHAFNICADIGHIAYVARHDGIEGLEKITIVVGIPIRPAAAERLPTAADIIEKLGFCMAQPKLDGFRLQIHIDKTKKQPKLHFFSRNLLDMSSMFPDLVAVLEALPVKTCIMEGEAIVFDEATGSFTPFQETVKRKRKHDIESVAEELPIKLFLFDILYLDGESQLNREHHTRYAALKELLAHTDRSKIELIEERPMETAAQLEAYFYETVGEGLEGLVVKRDKAHYQPGKRNFNWIKLKRQETGSLEDTLDLVVLGYWSGKGKRASFGIGAFLAGVYNPKHDAFETICKIGTGLTDAEWIELKKSCDKLAVAEQPHNVVCPKDLKPDVWVIPEIVVLVRADEITLSPVHTAGKTAHTLGYALRFPRFMGYRLDKSALQATTVAEVKTLQQQQKKN